MNSMCHVQIAKAAWPQLGALVTMTVLSCVAPRAALATTAPDADSPATTTSPMPPTPAVPQTATRETPTPTPVLKVNVRREGFVPYMPHANYRITIQVPEAKLQEGWRCCWIEAYPHAVAAVLARQEQKPVAGNDSDIQLDADRTETSLREMAPGIFGGDLFVASTQPWGSHTARIYVHLYQNANGADGTAYAEPAQRYRVPGNRIASEFLRDPAITVRFLYPPRPAQPALRPGDTVPGAPPSQLSHY